jgi:hypothetical protein
MRKVLLAAAAVSVLLAPTLAACAQPSVTTTFTVGGPPSTSISLTGTGPCTGTVTSPTAGTITCTAVSASGVQMATITVAPTGTGGWTGMITKGGVSAGSFTLGGATPNYTLLSSAALPAGSYTVTLTPTP